MPKSRQRKKSSTEKGRNNYSKADIKRINDSYIKKYEHYSAYTIEQLENILKAKTEKGIYLQALENVIKAKKFPRKINAADMLEAKPHQRPIEDNPAPQTLEL